MNLPTLSSLPRHLTTFAAAATKLLIMIATHACLSGGSLSSRAFVNIGPLAVHLHKFRGWKGPSKDVKRLEATLKSTKRFELQLNPAGRAVNDNAGCSPQQTCRSVQFTMRTYEIKNSMGTILELLSGFVFWTNSPSQG